MTGHRYIERLAKRLETYHRSARVEDECARLGSPLIAASRDAGKIGCLVLDLREAERLSPPLRDHYWLSAALHMAEAGAETRNTWIDRLGSHGHGETRMGPSLSDKSMRYFVEPLVHHGLNLEVARDFRWIDQEAAIHRFPRLVDVLTQYDTRYECIVVPEGDKDRLGDGMIVRQQVHVAEMHGDECRIGSFFASDLFSIDEIKRTTRMGHRLRLMRVEDQCFHSPCTSHFAELYDPPSPFLSPLGEYADAGINLNAASIRKSTAVEKS